MNARYWQTRLKTGIVCLVMATVLFRVSRTVVDPDLWGHVKFGQDIWETGRIVQSDPYSYTTEGPWINHEWLAEVLFALAYEFGGAAGLIGLKVAISLMILGPVYWFLCRRGLASLAAGLLVLLLVYVLFLGLVTVRPQLFTYLFFLAVLLVIHAAEEGRQGWLWAAPPVFALWANLHGGFLAGLAILFFWAGAHLLVFLSRTRTPSVLWSPSALKLYLACFASVLATFVNPYGPKLLVFLLRTATIPRPEIVEWLPLDLRTAEGFQYLLLIAITGIATALSRRPRHPALLAVVVGMAFAPLSAYRHLSLCALALVVLTADHFVGVWQRLAQRFTSPTEVASGQRLQPWLAGVAFFASVCLLGLAVPYYRGIRLEETDRYPCRAVALLKASQVSGRMAVPFHWGEYVIWHLGPGIQVSVDGRRETVYSTSINTQNLNFMFGAEKWDLLLKEHATDLVLMTKDFQCFDLMKVHPDFALVYEDSISGIFVRKDTGWIPVLRNAVPPEVSQDGVGTYFP